MRPQPRGPRHGGGGGVGHRDGRATAMARRAAGGAAARRGGPAIARGNNGNTARRLFLQRGGRTRRNRRRGAGGLRGMPGGGARGLFPMPGMGGGRTRHNNAQRHQQNGGQPDQERGGAGYGHGRDHRISHRAPGGKAPLMGADKRLGWWTLAECPAELPRSAPSVAIGPASAGFCAAIQMRAWSRPAAKSSVSRRSLMRRSRPPPCHCIRPEPPSAQDVAAP